MKTIPALLRELSKGDKEVPTAKTNIFPVTTDVTKAKVNKLVTNSPWRRLKPKKATTTPKIQALILRETIYK